jgi:outer membrane protein TolC
MMAVSNPQPTLPRQRRLLPLAAWVMALLSGCAVGPDYQTQSPEQLLPDHFAKASGSPTQSAQPPVSERWWTAFHDDALNQLVQAALQHSPDIAAAQASVRQARAALAQVSSAQLPQVSAQGRLGRDTVQALMRLGKLISLATPDGPSRAAAPKHRACWPSKPM